MDVYLTEYGLFAGGKRRVPEPRRAKFLTQAFKIALANPRVREMVQYLLVRPPAGQPGEFFATYLTSRTGKPLQAFRALGAFTRRQARSGAIATVPAGS